MSRTLRELAYEKQKAVTQGRDAYESILEQVRTDISKDHAETLARSVTEKSASEAVKRLIGEYVTAHQLRVGGMSVQMLADRLYGDMAGFGFLDKYISDPDIEEIDGNSWRDIEIVTRFGWHKAQEHFLSPQHAEDTLRKMVRLGGLVLDGTNPIVDSYITQGVRISAMIPPVTDKRSGAVFSIRRQRIVRMTKDQLLEFDTASAEMLDFLLLCINHGISIGFAGKRGSGKTTDLAFLLNAADKDKRIYTIEETRELDLLNEDVDGKAQNRIVQTCTRPSELKNANVDMNDLLRKALRFSPDIIAVAEMRGAEAMVAQEAARTGHVVVTSLHANSARKAYGRILSMCQMSGTNISTNILMGFVVEAFPVMVFKRQFSDGTRRIMEIVEATGVRDGVVQARTLFRFQAETGKFMRVGGVSEGLADTLLENGANAATVAKLQEVRT
ncbi:MAG: CpaF family protein [Clostridia bacterium]|nr:CpaF family protein [Clostridia bacterium]